MSGAGQDPLGAAMTLLAAVLQRPGLEARHDTPLSALGADAVALLLWADRVERAAPGRRVDPAALETATTAGDLARLRSATMGPASTSEGDAPA